MSSAKSLCGRRVLIVEDRYLLASEMAGEVRKMGGHVLGPARDLLAAEAIIGAECPDLALLDINLDGELVFPLAEELSRRNAPFIFLTGYDEDTLPETWRRRPRLQKPVEPAALRTQLLRLSQAAEAHVSRN